MGKIAGQIFILDRIGENGFSEPSGELDGAKPRARQVARNAQGVKVDFATKFQCSKFAFIPISVEDSQVLFDAVSSKEFPSELPLGNLNTIADARSWCTDRAAEWETNSCFVWTCHTLDNTDVIGQVTLLPQQNRLALSYWVHPKYWGHGFATQMCHSLLSHIRKLGYLGEIWAGVHSWNTKSESVLLKLGFKQTTESGELEVKEYSLKMVG